MEEEEGVIVVVVREGMKRIVTENIKIVIGMRRTRSGSALGPA